jgi:hypothetical protein
VAFSPDGLRIVTGSDMGSAKVWDACAGGKLFDLEGHSGSVKSVAFSPDGLRIITGSEDQMAKVWDAKTGTPLIDLKGHTDAVEAVAVSPDGTRIVTGSKDHSAIVREAKIFARNIELSVHSDSVVAFSPDDHYVLTGGQSAKIWDANTGRLLIDLKERTRAVSCAMFSPDGRLAVTASPFDKAAKVWDAKTGELLFELMQESQLYVAYFSADGQRIVTSGMEKETKRVWNAKNGQELKGEPLPKTHANGRNSSDGRIFAHVLFDRVELIKLHFDEFSYRLLHTRPTFYRYVEGYLAAQQINDGFAMQFYLERALSMFPYIGNLKLRNQIQPDPRLTARTGFHHPELAKTTFDRIVLQALAVNGDRLAKRLIAQACLRDGKPGDAVPLLFECLLMRPITHPPKPPVEELLLAQAYLDLKQLDEAKRYYRAAANWLELYERPIQAMNIVSHSALNPWAGLGEAFAPVDDPRRNPFDWESWHECDVFRAEIGARLK